MRPVGSPEELERRRIRAMHLLQEGHPPVEVARRVGVDRRSVRRWKAAYRKARERGIEAKPAPGRPPKLDANAKRGLQRALLKGASACGFASDLWTCPRIAQWLKGQYGIRYHPAHVSRLLHALGFSPQRPTRRAIERDEKEIQRWVREEWPRVKKTPPA